VKLDGFSLAVTCGVLMLGSQALAQSPGGSHGSSGGLFGATGSGSAGRDKLNVLTSMSQSLDSKVPAEFRSVVPANGTSSGGRSTLLFASADYAHSRRHLQLFGTASTYFRYDPSIGRTTTVSRDGEFGAAVPMPKQGSLRITQKATYSPSYLNQLFPTAAPPSLGEAIPANPEYRIGQNDSQSYGTNLDLAIGSSRGTSVTATAEYELTRSGQRTAAALPNFTTYSTGARISHFESRSATFLAAYEYRIDDFAVTGQTKTHKITMGMAYSPALSRSRRLALHLEVSPSLVETPGSAPAAVIPPVTTADEPGVQGAVVNHLYPVQIEASVAYPFRPKWLISASYSRSMQSLAVLTEPVYSNGAQATLTGVIGRRIDVSGFAGYAAAASTDSSGNQDLTTYTGQARVRYALTRSVALYSEYLYSYYDLRGRVVRTPGLPPVFAQHGIRVGFTFFGQAFSK
jgi:hypothetical protein